MAENETDDREPGPGTIAISASTDEPQARVRLKPRFSDLVAEHQKLIDSGWDALTKWGKTDGKEKPDSETLIQDLNPGERLGLIMDDHLEEHERWLRKTRAIKKVNSAFEPTVPPVIGVLMQWLATQPIRVDPETRQDSRILPAITTAKQDLNQRSEVLVTTLAGAHEKPADLSFFPQAERHEVPLLDLVDGAEMPIRTAGRGAPLESRLIVSAILAVPQSSRGRDTVRFSVPLRDLVEAIYTGKWNRTNQWPPLRDLLRSIGDRGVRLRHRGSIWRPVFCREIPDADARLDAPVTFDVAFPPGTTTGPQINPRELAQRGVRSSPEWRAYIAAATLAWVPGRSRVPVPGRRHYGWSRDPQAYPVLTLETRKRLAYGETQHRRSKEKIDAVWRNIPGFTVLENQTDEKTQIMGWRIVPEEIAEELMKKTRKR